MDVFNGMFKWQVAAAALPSQGLSIGQSIKDCCIKHQGLKQSLQSLMLYHSLSPLPQTSFKFKFSSSSFLRSECGPGEGVCRVCILL